MVELDQGGRLKGRAALQAGPPSIAGIVESTFVLPTEAQTDRSWRIVPDLSAHLLLHFHESPSGPVLAHARVVGARTRFVDVPVRPRAFSVGLRFVPGALHALSGLPGSELLDRSLDVREVWRAPGRRLVERAASAADSETVRHLLLELVGELATGTTQVDWRVRGFSALLRSGGTTHVAAGSNRLGISPRSLRRTCREIVGLTPKRMARIERLHRCIGAGIRRGCGRSPLNGLAAGAGYADQAHMIRDFRALLGETPVRFLGRRRASAGRFVQ